MQKYLKFQFKIFRESVSQIVIFGGQLHCIQLIFLYVFFFFVIFWWTKINNSISLLTLHEIYEN